MGAILLLAQQGFQVVAVSGKADSEESYLKGLGASEVVARASFEGDPKPLGKELYGGAVDSCGGKVISDFKLFVTLSSLRCLLTSCPLSPTGELWLPVGLLQGWVSTPQLLLSS